MGQTIRVHEIGGGGGGAVNSVSATSPLSSTGGTDPNISLESGQNTVTDLQKLANNLSISTGITSNGVAIAVNVDTTKWDLPAGSCILVDNTNLANPVRYNVSWTVQSALTVTNLLTDPRTNVAIALDNTPRTGVSFTNSFSGTVNGSPQTIYIAEKTENFDPVEERLFCRLGRLSHGNLTNISFTIPIVQHADSYHNSLLDFISLFPSINVEGNEYSGKAGVTQVAKTAGKGFRYGSNYAADPNNPNIQDIPAADPTSHAYRYRNGSGGFTQTSFSNNIDPNGLDDGTGVLAPVQPNRYTLQPVWVFAGSGSMFVQYGQQQFASKEAAIEALATINPVLDQNLVDDAVFRGWFVLQQGATDFSDPAQFEWRPPLSERGSGTGQAVIVDLQTAYINSLNPEIETVNGPVDLREGTGNDATDVITVQNGAGTKTFGVDGNGNITANNLPTVLEGFSADVTGNLNGNTNYTQTFTVTGAVVGDKVDCGFNDTLYDAIIGSSQDAVIMGKVSSANTVEVTFRLDSFIAGAAGRQVWGRIIK